MLNTKIDKILLFCIFIILSIYLGLESYHWAVILLCMILGVLFKGNKINLKTFVITSLTIILTFFYVQARLPKEDLLYTYSPDYIQSIGTIVSFPQSKSGNRVKLEFETDSISFENKKITIDKKQKSIVTIYNANENNFKIGDKYKIKGKIKQPFEAKNPNEFSYKEYLKQKNIFTLIYANYKNINKIRGPDNFYYKIIQEIGNARDNIIKSHQIIIGKEKSALLGGLVFGDDAIFIPANIKEMFKKSGLLHLLAASGMNVALIFGIWFFIARFFMPVNKATFIGIFIVLLYAIMTGLPPSVLRATIMLEMVLIGKLLNQEYKTLNILMLAGILILLYNPMSFYSVSLQLSFIVTFGIVFMFSEITKKLKQIPQWLSGAVLIPVIAQIWVMPLQAYYFNSFNLYSIFANILIVPFMGIISFFSFISSIIALIPYSEFIYKNIDKLLSPLFDIVLFISASFASLPNSVINVSQPSITQIILFYILCISSTLLLKYETNKNFNKAVFSLWIIFCLSFTNLNIHKELSILSFSIGEGDAFLIETPENKHILIDTAKHSFFGYSPAKYIINGYLKDKGIKKLEYLVLTHPDSDHIGGTLDILKEFKVDKIIQTSDKAESKTYKNIQKYLNNHPINVEIIEDKKEISLEQDIQIKIVKPNGSNDNTFNDDSLILYLKYKDFDALFMGDNEKESLKTLTQNKFGKIDYFKVGHHASYDSVSREMLEYLEPKISVISVGKNNYGHPSSSVIKLLKKYSNVYRTDTQNAIKTITDGRKTTVYNWDISTKKWKKQIYFNQRLDKQAMVLIK